MGLRGGLVDYNGCCGYVLVCGEAGRPSPFHVMLFFNFLVIMLGVW